MCSRKCKSDRLVLSKKMHPLAIKRLFAILETANLMHSNDCREALNYLNKCREASNSTIKGNTINEVIYICIYVFEDIHIFLYTHMNKYLYI
jgi:hypothetical protein